VWNYFSHGVLWRTSHTGRTWMIISVVNGTSHLFASNINFTCKNTTSAQSECTRSVNNLVLEHLNNEGQKWKTGHVIRKGVNEEGKGGWIQLRQFLHMNEYGTLKPVEIILRSGRGKRENNEGWTRVHCNQVFSTLAMILGTFKCHAHRRVLTGESFWIRSWATWTRFLSSWRHFWNFLLSSSSRRSKSMAASSKAWINPFQDFSAGTWGATNACSSHQHINKYQLLINSIYTEVAICIQTWLYPALWDKHPGRIREACKEAMREATRANWMKRQNVAVHIKYLKM
jgi:hypothetical protein